MSDFIYAIKMLAITACLIFVMQIRVGAETIESHSLAFIRGSAAVESLNGVAQGAVKAMAQGYQTIAGFMDRNVGKVFTKDIAAGSRLEAFSIRRSDAYEKAQEAKRKAQAEIEEASKEVEEAID